MNGLSGGAAQSEWAGKTWAVIGDSITEHNDKTTFNYQDILAWWTGVTPTNYGISGTGWRTPSASGAGNAFYQRLSEFTDHDLFTLFGGTNDWAEVGISMTLGSFGDTAGSTSFYGAVDETLSTLIGSFPTRKFAVFTPTRRSDAFYNLQHGTDGVGLKDVADAIRAVANKYNVPVLDLYNTGNMQAWETGFQTAYMPDGLHPNYEGHLRLAQIIKQFLETI